MKYKTKDVWRLIISDMRHDAATLDGQPVNYLGEYEND